MLPWWRRRTDERESENAGECFERPEELLTRHIDKPAETIPQAFTPYKEVLEIYSNGLELPDDVTIIWADDNFGYMNGV